MILEINAFKVKIGSICLETLENYTMAAQDKFSLSTNYNTNV